jgi:hypothetical protein
MCTTHSTNLGSKCTLCLDVAEITSLRCSARKLLPVAGCVSLWPESQSYYRVALAFASATAKQSYPIGQTPIFPARPVPKGGSCQAGGEIASFPNETPLGIAGTLIQISKQSTSAQTRALRLGLVVPGHRYARLNAKHAPKPCSVGILCGIAQR